MVAVVVSAESSGEKGTPTRRYISAARRESNRAAKQDIR